MVTELKIGQVAKLADVGIHTLRFYEREGLLPAAARSRAGFRMFPPAAVDRVAFIKKAQRLGFTLTEIGELLRSIDRGIGDRRSAQREIERVVARIDVKLADLRRVRRDLVGAAKDVSSGKCDIARIVARISAP